MNNVTKLALDEIKKSRLRALSEAKQIENDLMDDERYSAVCKELAIAGIALARARSDGKDASLLQRAYDDLLDKKRNVLASLGYPNGITPEFDCPKCNDTGVYRNAQCSCVRKKVADIIKSKLRTGNVPSFRFQDFKAEVVESTGQRKALTSLYRSMEKMCEKFPDTKHLNVVLSGKTGVGKTCVFSAVANELVSRGFAVLFLTAFELNTRFLRYHTSPLAEREIYLADVMDCDMLIIDDLGTEPMLKNVTTEYLLCVLSERTARGRHTFISTNLTSDDILARYGERFYSRVFDKMHSLAVGLEGDDLRRV